MYKEIPFYRGDTRQKSKTGSVGDEAQFSTVFFLFSVFFTYSLAQEQAVGRCLNIAYIAYITFPYSTQGAGKPEQEEGTLCFYVDQTSLLNILNLGAQSENQTYLLEVISRHDSSFWDPSL